MSGWKLTSLFCARTASTWPDGTAEAERSITIWVSRDFSGSVNSVGWISFAVNSTLSGNLNVSFLTTQKRHCRPRNLRLLADALNLRLGTNVVPNGRDDLTLEPGERKVSGTAARISHGRAYHHLTLLVDVDVERLKTALRSPYAVSI